LVEEVKKMIENKIKSIEIKYGERLKNNHEFKYE